MSEIKRKNDEGIDIDRIDLDESGELSGLDDDTLDAISGGLSVHTDTEKNPMCP